MRIKIVMGFMENGFYGKNRHTLIKQKWRQNSWTILESRERQKQCLCCCVQCSQSSAFLWLLYHLIKTVEESAFCYVLISCSLWMPLPFSGSRRITLQVPFLLSWPLQPEAWCFQVGLLWTASRLIFWFPGLANILYLPLLSPQESVRYIKFFLKLLTQLP